ncbi:FGGY-family carbohydrate kinase [Georgenia deserti]|uniref:L-fuculokinase n=1 Tax=Georgenia deserti TaxID=2093781 RepID=A0ABW4L727_9MICO
MTTTSSDILALGIDVGTTNTKATLVAVDPTGVRELALAAAPTPSDAPGLLAMVARVVDDVLGETSGGPHTVGIASMAETGVCLDKHDEPTTGLLRWDPRRATGQASRLADSYGADALFAATGVRPSGKTPLATWAWLRDHGFAFDRWAGAADFVALALTGVLVTDHTLAGRTMAYRMGGAPAETFDAELLELAGLRPGQLPHVAAPDDVAAHVSHAALRRFGLGELTRRLAPGTPVTVAGHDHPVGAWAAGARGPGERADSLGTAEAVLTVLPAPPAPAPVAAAGMSWVRTVSSRHDALLAGTSSAGAMLGWLADHLTDTTVADALVAAAGDVRRTGAPAGPMVLPYLAGRQTPAPDPQARVRVLGSAAGADPALVARSVLDGIALQARWMLEEQAGLGEAAPGPVTVLGSLLEEPAVAETKRLATAAPLRRVTAREPVATGAGLLGAVRAGLLGPPGPALGNAPVLPAVDLPPPANDPYRTALTAFTRAATEGER